MTAKNDLHSIDDLLDEKFGKVGTSERTAFRRDAYAYYIGQLLCDARKEQKLTQTALAKRIGTNKSYISKIENGDVQPTIGIFGQILDALGLRLEISRPIL